MKKVTPGEPIKIRAEDWNALADLISAQKIGLGSVGGLLGSLAVVQGIAYPDFEAQRYTPCAVSIDRAESPGFEWQDGVCPEDCPVAIVPYSDYWAGGNKYTALVEINRLCRVGILLDNIKYKQYSFSTARVLLRGGSWCWIPDQELVDERPHPVPMNLRYTLDSESDTWPVRRSYGPLVVRYTTSRVAEVQTLVGPKQARLCYVEIARDPILLPLKARDDYITDVDPPVVEVKLDLPVNDCTPSEPIYCALPYPSFKYPNVRYDDVFLGVLLSTPETIANDEDEYICHFSARAGHLDAPLGIAFIVDPRVVENFSIPKGWEAVPLPTDGEGNNYHLLAQTDGIDNSFKLYNAEKGHYHEIHSETVTAAFGNDVLIRHLSQSKTTKTDFNLPEHGRPVPWQGLFMIRRIK